MSSARLLRRGRIWYVVISYVDEDGRHHQRWKSTGTTDKRVAEDQLRDTQIEIRAGLNLALDPTVAEWLKTWLADVTGPGARKTLAPSTADCYRRNIERDLTPRIGDIRLRDLKPADVQKVNNDLLASGMKRATVRYVHATLRAALHEAERQGLVLRNAAALARAPMPDDHESAHLTAAECHRLIAANSESEWLPYIEIALLTGLRRGELLGLRWADVDLDRGELAVKQQRQRLPKAGGVTERAVKSKAGERTVALPHAAVVILRRLRATQARESLLSRTSAPAHVFAHRRAGLWRPWSPEFCNDSVKACFKRAGLPVPAQPNHILRHTHLTTASRVGMSMKDAQVRAGHADPQVTIRVYQHGDVEGQRPGAEAIADLLLPKATEDANAEADL